MRFAVEPSAETAADVPFASELALGLGPALIKTIDEDQVQQFVRWDIHREYFRAVSRRWNALDLIAELASETESLAVDEGRGFQVSVGDHRHCVSPPVPAPPGLAGLRRVSLQPASPEPESCLMWFTVDLFVTDDGEVSAVTLDVWEP